MMKEIEKIDWNSSHLLDGMEIEYNLIILTELPLLHEAGYEAVCDGDTKKVYIKRRSDLK